MKKIYVRPIMAVEEFVPNEYVATCYYMQGAANDKAYDDYYNYDSTNKWYVETGGQKRTHGYCMTHESIYNSVTQKMNDITDENRSIENVAVNLTGIKGSLDTYTEVTSGNIWSTIHDALHENGTLDVYWEEHDPDHLNATENNPAIWYHYGVINKVGGPS